MREDQPSSTALMVCAGRATAHELRTVRGFSDPFAERLLPPDYRSRLARAVRSVLRRGAHLFALRTMAIDEGIRTADKLEQLVILGAGLDSRAWRMAELQDVDVYEVDHPATQRYKRMQSRDFPDHSHHHFVSVDFERDSLEERLTDEGHRSDVPTVWVWEGVTMYLNPDAIEGTVATIANRSAPDSRLLVTYQPPGLSGAVVGKLTSLFGEPFLAAFSPATLAELLERYGFSVTRDECYADWHARWGEASGLLDSIFAQTERLATADLSETLS